MTALCLNMIVRNEMANLERCLAAVAPHVASWVIGDTGSTDGSQAFIRAFFAERAIPGELHEFPFIDFEQARNAALRAAYDSPLTFDWLLFADADMELVVEDAAFAQRLSGNAHQLLQRSGGVSYWNTRLARRGAGAWYRGVTHEYLDVPAGETAPLAGAWYLDHASGANRPEKSARDIALLAVALEREPENARYWFYLGQSYRDAGRLAEAAEAYARRAGMGGWGEEAWEARLQLARCRRDLKEEGAFVAEALAAFDERPARAEPLHDLARHYRIKGQNELAVLFAERGLELAAPAGDTLFVEDWIYQYGLAEEFSIAAFYVADPARKARGAALCDALAFDRSVPQATRDQAAANLEFYLDPLSALAPSFTASPVPFTPPAGWQPLNPSVTGTPAGLILVQRTVNYTIDEAYPDGDGRRFATVDGAPIITRNFLLRLTDDLAVASAVEILPPADLPPPAWPWVLGLEDVRPFAVGDELWCVACVRELSAEGWCEQLLARIAGARLTDWRVLRPQGPQRHEKNWTPLADRLVYSNDPTRILDDQARTVAESIPPINAEGFRGGTQWIAFDGGWLSIVHEVAVRDGERRYRHRFVRLDADCRMRAVSRAFFFHQHGVEFAAGLAWHPDGRRLVISYGVADAQAWLATVDAEEVRNSGDTILCSQSIVSPELRDSSGDTISIVSLELSPLTELLHTARGLIGPEPPEIRRAWLAQIEVNFPLIFLANLLLIRRAREKGWDHILFSARDCWLWSRLYEALAPLIPGAPSGAYFMTGRVARAHPSDDYLAYFAAMRSGQRNVVIDLAGTGWSLSRLIEASGASDTDIFFVHQLDLPGLVDRYARFGALKGPIRVEAPIRRGLAGGSVDVLEDLNRALHPAVEDVARDGEAFTPIFSPLEIPAEARRLIAAHHAAFAACTRLATQLDLESLLAHDPTHALIAAYARTATGLSEPLAPIFDHQQQEEQRVWAILATPISGTL